MQVGMSTACFYPAPTEDAARWAAELGVEEIEVFFNAESEFSPTFLQPLRRYLDGAGVRVKSFHPYTSALEGLLLFSDYDRRTRDALDQYERYFEGAASLGARYCTFHGERDMPVVFQEETTARLAETYHRLCERAARCGMTIAQENVAWCKSSRPEYLRVLRERVPELRYTLDIKQAYRARRRPDEYLAVMGDRLVNVHLNDFDAEHSCLLPGEGHFDFVSLFSALRALGYDDSVLIEVYSTNYQGRDQLARSIRSLKQLVSPCFLDKICYTDSEM